MNAFDNTGESRATVVIAFQPGGMSRLGGHVWEGIAPTLRAEARAGDNSPHVLILDGTRVDDVRVYDDGITPCLKNRMGTGGNNVPMVAQETTHDVVGTLQARSYKGPNHENARDGQLIIVAREPMEIAIPIQDGRDMDKKQNGLGVGEEGDPSCNQGGLAIVDTINNDRAQAYDEYNDQLGGDIHHAIRAGTKQSTEVMVEMQVRRLTPVECERLMGWPDNHTLNRADGKTNSDTTRYKMCGNGVASPVAQWIAQHITVADQEMRNAQT